MAHSLEVRVPILDHKFVEWVSGLDNKYKFDGHTGKSLLKKTMEPHLPHDVLYRKKMGFSVPLDNWFRGPLQTRMKDALGSERLLDSGWFNGNFLKQVGIEHSNGSKNHGTLIWSIVMFDEFLRQKV